MNAIGQSFENALRAKDTHACLELLKQNPDLVHQIQANKIGKRTALYMATEFANPEVIDKLLEMGAKTNIALKYQGQINTPLSYAKRYHNSPESVSDQRIQNIYITHLAQRQAVPAPTPVLGALRDRASALFNTVAGNVAKLLRNDAVGLAGAAGIAASFGAAIGVGVVAAPAMIVGTTVGASVVTANRILSAMQNPATEKDLARVASAESYYADKVKMYEPPVKMNVAPTQAEISFPKSLAVHIQSTNGTSIDRIPKGVLSVMLEMTAAQIEEGKRAFEFVGHDVVVRVGDSAVMGADAQKEALRLDLDTTTSAFSVHTPEWEAGRVLRDASEQVTMGDRSFALKDLHGETIGQMRNVPAAVAVELATANGKSVEQDLSSLSM